MRCLLLLIPVADPEGREGLVKIIHKKDGRIGFMFIAPPPTWALDPLLNSIFIQYTRVTHSNCICEIVPVYREKSQLGSETNSEKKQVTSCLYYLITTHTRDVTFQLPNVVLNGWKIKYKFSPELTTATKAFAMLNIKFINNYQITLCGVPGNA